MNKKTLKRRKGGFSLVECIVALLLFSIIMVSVLTAFTSSHGQINIQNEQYKADIMVNNVLAAYEGSNNLENFITLLHTYSKDIVKDDYATLVSGNKVIQYSEAVKVQGGEGGGEYKFNPESIPLSIPLDNIVANNEKVTINCSDKKTATVGSYTVDGTTYAWELGDDFKTLKSMTISGKSYVNNYNGGTWLSYSWTVENDTVTFSYTNPSGTKKSQTQNACGFDKYLLENGYYLKPMKKDYSVIYDCFWYQVMNVIDNTPVQDQNGNNLYILVNVTGTNIIGYNGSIDKFFNGNAADICLNLSRSGGNATIYFKYASSLPNIQSFSDILKDKNGNAFEGEWWFYSWMVSNCVKTGWLFNGGVEGSSSDDANSMYNFANCFSVTGVQRKLTADSGIENNLSYALSDDGTVLMLFNSDGKLILKCDGNPDDSLKELVTKLSFGVIPSEDSKTSEGSSAEDSEVQEKYVTVSLNGKNVKVPPNTYASYNETDYYKWYKPGVMPKLTVTYVSFHGKDDADNPDHKYKIVFHGKDDNNTADIEYVTFYYDNFDTFDADRAAILDFTKQDDAGSYSRLYQYTKVYEAKEKINITDANTLKNYENYEKLKNIPFGTTTVSTDTLIWYTIDSPWLPTRNVGSILRPKYEYDHTYTYYKYQITTTKTIAITNYKETSRGLKILYDGSKVEITESIQDVATIMTIYNYDITVINSGSTVTVTTNSIDTPSNTPSQVAGGTKVTKFKDTTIRGTVNYDYSDKNWVLNNFDKTQNTSAEYNNIVSAPVHSVIPFDLNEKWTLTAEPKTANLVSQRKYYSFEPNDDSGSLICSLSVGTAESNEIIFIAHPSDYKMAATTSDNINVSANAMSLQYIAGGKDEAGIEITIIEGYTKKPDEKHSEEGLYMFALVTYSNYAKDNEIDPSIHIWVMPESEKSKITAHMLENLSSTDRAVRTAAINDMDQKYSEHYEYRKG